MRQVYNLAILRRVAATMKLRVIPAIVACGVLISGFATVRAWAGQAQAGQAQARVAKAIAAQAHHPVAARPALAGRPGSVTAHLPAGITQVGAISGLVTGSGRKALV